MNAFEELKRFFRRGGALTQLILINVGIFLVLKILGVGFFLFRQENLEQVVLGFLALPADPGRILLRPWTIVTYMFLHYGFFHVLFNMLWLYWFGKIFLEHLNARKLLSVYLLGGLAGGVVYVLSYNIFPAFRESLPNAVALGASAAILAVVMSIAFYVPNYSIHLMFIGQIKLKHIAWITILIDILSIRSENAGGHLAHLGGALFGVLYALQLKGGRDMTGGFSRFMDNLASLFRKRPGTMRVRYRKSPGRPETDREYNARKTEEQQQIDRILDKISKSGYNGLSKEEKEILFRSNKK